MDHGGAIVRGYVMSPDDALAENYDVLLVDDVTSFLSRRLIAGLQGRGTRIIGVYDAIDGDGAGRQRLLELGVDEALPATSPPAEFLEVITRLVGPFLDDDPELSELLADVAMRRPATAHLDHGPRGAPGSSGRVVAVAAAAGGAGATEIAVALAAAIRDQGDGTVLVDADDQAPSVAQRLGLPLHPNIRTAVDAVHHGNGDPGGGVTRLSELGLEVVCGLPNPRDWYELRASEVVATVLELAATRRRAVVNVGPRIDDLPQLGGPARFGVSRGLLAAADDVVLVGTASPVGARRVVDWLADAAGLLSGTPVHLVINQHPGSTFALGELESELRRSFTPRSFHAVPFDKRVIKAAWEGTPVARGPFTRAVGRLAQAFSEAGVAA
jgi:MinD-like ATPase involved in chromosome partitioning or flagellar assembly